MLGIKEYKDDTNTMKNNEFFKALQDSNRNATMGECAAFNAWCDGIRAKSGFPVLKTSMWENEIADFLVMIEKAGFKKFGFFSKSTCDLCNIVAFVKAGWEVTGTFEIPNAFEDFGYEPDEGLVFERRN